MRTTILAAALGAAALTGCSTLGIGDRNGRRAGAELIGQTLRLQPSSGQATTLRFAGDGTVRATFGNRTTTGRWRVRDERLCFFWGPAPRECWPYAAPFRRGRTVTLTSDRGNVVRVTLR